MLKETIRKGIFRFGEGVTGGHYHRADLDMNNSISYFGREVDGALKYHPSMRKIARRFIQLQNEGYIGIMSVPGHLDPGTALVEPIRYNQSLIVAVILAQEYFVPFESHYEGIRLDAQRQTHDVIRTAVEYGNQLADGNANTMNLENFHQYITDIVMGRSSIDY